MYFDFKKIIRKNHNRCIGKKVLKKYSCHFKQFLENKITYLFSFVKPYFHRVKVLSVDYRFYVRRKIT